MSRLLLERLEVLEHGHIEVDPRRIAEIVAAGVAKGEAARRGKGPRVQKQRADIVSALRDKGLTDVGFADHIRIGADSQSVADAGVIRRAGAVTAAAVDDAERGSGFKGGDAAELPFAQQCFRERRKVRGRDPFRAHRQRLRPDAEAVQQLQKAEDRKCS